MTIQCADTQRISAFLQQHPDWSIEHDKLHREYGFKNFVEAFGFMTQAALVAERSNHHPEWCNVYNRVVVDLMTHEAGGITQRDFALATAMEEIATGQATRV